MFTSVYFFSLLVLRTQNQRMDYISQTVGGYGVISIFRDWIRRLVPYFWGDGEIAPN